MSREAAGRLRNCTGAKGPPVAPQLPCPAAGTWRVQPRARPRPGPPRLKLGPRQKGARGPRVGHEMSCCPFRAWWGEPGHWAGQQHGLQGHVETPHPELPWSLEGRSSVQRSQRKQATGPALPSGFPCPPGLRGCLAAPHPLSSPGPSSIHLSMATGTLPCPAPAQSPLPCTGSTLAPKEQKPCFGLGLSLASLPALTALQASPVPGCRVPGQAQPCLFPELGTSPDSGLPESRGMRGQTSGQPAQSRDPHLGQRAGHRRRQAVGGSWSSGPPSLSREAPCHGGEVASCCGLAAACVCLALPLEGGPEGEGSGASRAGAR